MKLYHVSKKKYEVDDVIENIQGNNSLFYSNSDDSVKQTIDYFDNYLKQNNLGLLPRKSALFAFESMALALSYKQSDSNLKENAFIYEVEMDVSYKGPMILMQTLKDSLQVENLANSIIEEYLNYNQNNDDSPWRFIECVGNNMKIISKKTCQCGITPSLSWYMDDRDKSQRKFGK